mmetsp:Transcript_40583/g.60184  ORF Transcript_40583/g.60184 Transcript_40583/m.60184 type:complete len:171 (-) Transcript_40583:1057-1569(-)|eukprot:CAMPEP_0194033548 /NCGR_PEP_ID=MMETSP0009_2-20130614/6201_1 /TAXON_ID=210454 /ORGANISM="Grammatophora oceanica, Strain CCMP 410" /LENGTH=170 /DNA_ID=CAMNT_0038674261 /DNA_START=76 /DNA_END=588 /DNA_ORIENTATION=+
MTFQKKAIGKDGGVFAGSVVFWADCYQQPEKIGEDTSVPHKVIWLRTGQCCKAGAWTPDDDARLATYIDDSGGLEKLYKEDLYSSANTLLQENLQLVGADARTDENAKPLAEISKDNVDIKALIARLKDSTKTMTTLQSMNNVPLARGGPQAGASALNANTAHVNSDDKD